MDRYIPTGNETVSLPTLNEMTAAVESISFLTMAQKGMISLQGASLPLVEPFVEQNGRDVPLTALCWHREHGWIPAVSACAGNMCLHMTVLTPVGERGFGLRLLLEGGDSGVRFGLRGSFGEALHCINESKPIEAARQCYSSGWNGSFIFDMRAPFSLFAIAPMADKPCECDFAPDGSRYSLRVSGEEKELTVWWGLGFEEVSAATSAKEMLRRTWEYEYNKTAAWLDKRSKTLSTPRLTEIYNTNLFFCLFYSTGVTLDTEELICATSRSPRYYVSAAYWDRDTLLWSFPAILDADGALARRILEYVFTRQRKNLGVHSRYIDGTVLEPGFELDELAAPVLALASYVRQTGDVSILSEDYTRAGIRHILVGLEEVREARTGLYETFLQPTDDERVYPYITYDNVLVWRVFTELAALWPEEYGDLAQKAALLRRAIYDNCVFGGDKPYFGWSVDLCGRHDVYDEPPGSLQLLPYYGFCSSDDPVWLNTVERIRSKDYKYSFAGHTIAEIGCPHAPYPWVLSLCNSLLCGYADRARQELEGLKMDNGIACESVDAESGECMTGAAFATCAGFLCHTMLISDREAGHEK